MSIPFVVFAAPLLTAQAFEMAPARTDIHQSLPAQSITVYSTYKLAHADPGVIAED